MAYEQLENNLILREKHQKWLKNFDCTDPTMHEILSLGCFLFLNQRDEFGRKITVVDFGKANMEKYSVDEYIKAYFFIWSIFIDEEESQVAGYVSVISFVGFHSDMISFFPIEVIKNFCEIGLKGNAIRSNKLIIIGVPSFAKNVMHLTINLLSKTLKERVEFYETFEKIPFLKLMPKEYGGCDISLDEYKKLNLQTLLDNQGMISKYNQMTIAVHLKDIDCNVGSFRNLQVD